MRCSLVHILILFISVSAVAAKSKSMKVHLTFEPVKTSIRMKVYKLPIEKAIDIGEIWTSSLSEPPPSPSTAISDGFMLKKGGIQPFLMVAENPTNEPLYFFAVAHTVIPEHAGVGFKLGCLCNNHIFEVSPKSRWMRVGSINLEQHAQGPEIRLVHKIIGITKETIKEKGLTVDGIKKD